ncbi:hypothetical protein GCM10027194_27110 [Thalassiella azotivora]
MGARAGRPGPARDPGPWPLVALLVVVLVGVTVVVTAAGPVSIERPRVTGFGLEVLVGLGDEEAPADPASTPAPDEEEPRGLPGWTAVAWLMAMLGVVVVAVRWVLAALAGEDEPRDGSPEEDVAGGDARATVGAVRRGVRRAHEELDLPGGGRSADDAVVACWLALEDAAGRTGARRLPAQTPTEFTAALLGAVAADREATAELLRLYQRARFGSTPLPGEAVPAARRALERIAASLPDATTGDGDAARPAGPVAPADQGTASA